MSNALFTAFASVLLVSSVAHAQESKTPSPSSTPTSITMTGCISAKPQASGQYVFSEADRVREYKLSGKEIRKFAGLRVEVVGSTPGNGLTIRTGLWPTPSGGARGVAQDPGQAAIARQPGGGGAGADRQFQEFRVSRIRTLEGVCE